MHDYKQGETVIVLKNGHKCVGVVTKITKMNVIAPGKVGVETISTIVNVWVIWDNYTEEEHPYIDYVDYYNKYGKDYFDFITDTETNKYCRNMDSCYSIDDVMKKTNKLYDKIITDHLIDFIKNELLKKDDYNYTDRDMLEDTIDVLGYDIPNDQYLLQLPDDIYKLTKGVYS